VLVYFFFYLPEISIKEGFYQYLLALPGKEFAKLNYEEELIES